MSHSLHQVIQSHEKNNRLPLSSDVKPTKGRVLLDEKNPFRDRGFVGNRKHVTCWGSIHWSHTFLSLGKQIGQCPGLSPLSALGDAPESRGFASGADGAAAMGFVHHAGLIRSLPRGPRKPQTKLIN